MSLGRRNQAIGEQLESWVEAQHELAGHLGILAHVVHNEASSKIVGGRHIYVAAGVSDYTGCLEGAGNGGIARYLAVEVKSVDGERLPRKRIELKQQEHLDAVARAGGLALLLIEFRVEMDPLVREVSVSRYAVPYLEVPWRVLRTAESVAMGEIQSWLIAPGTCYLQRWHPGGLRSGAGNVGGTRARRRVFARE